MQIAPILSPGATVPELPVLKGLELFSEDATPQDFLVEGIIPTASQGILYSRPGVGKTKLMQVVAVAVASGTPAFGALAVRHGRVLFVTGEESRRQLRLGMAMTIRGGGCQLEDVVHNMTFAPLREVGYHLNTPEGRNALEKVIMEHRPVLVALDTLPKLGSVDIKDDNAVMPLFDFVSRVNASAGVTFVWTAHQKKGQVTNQLEALFGSVQQGGQMDFVIHAHRSMGELFLSCAKGRGIEEFEKVRLKVDIDRDVSYGLTLLPSRKAEPADSGSDDPKDTKREDAIAAIRAYLEANPGSRTGELRDSVAKKLKRKPATIGSLIKELGAEGAIRNDRDEKGHRLYWVHADPTPA